MRLAHAVESFALLAVRPATTHVGWGPPFHGVITRTQLILPILTEFLDSP